MAQGSVPKFWSGRTYYGVGQGGVLWLGDVEPDGGHPEGPPLVAIQRFVPEPVPRRFAQIGVFVGLLEGGVSAYALRHIPNVLLPRVLPEDEVLVVQLASLSQVLWPPQMVVIEVSVVF
jgi:hypothetical protein